ncbi:hydrogenase 4 membrane component (E)-like protein [Acidianus hospitalis W1]|uniref:Hydrogenase 4 membrane component (E)-like protein n=1 Tax=Acidianus hospitalis (strain W1) TaxID=933801 RepID=F4B4I2_ACIHW|nr:hydrogenase [Acidianus hospitalis]AEE93071.1 hydrogenase 4 membrane component (E)-like protein [Acidianus hospitalis W1]
MIKEEIIELISVIIIITAFYIQGQAYYKPLVKMSGVQSIILAILSTFLGIITGIVDYFILAIIIVTLRGIITPYVLIKMLGNKFGEREKIKGVASLLVIDLAFFFIAIIIIYEFIIGRIFHQVELLFPLSLFFQGLYLIVSRNSTPAQIIGYIEEENGIVMLGLFLIPLPLLVEASVFLDVLGLVVISSLLIFEKREHKALEELKG